MPCDQWLLIFLRITPWGITSSALWHLTWVTSPTCLFCCPLSPEVQSHWTTRGPRTGHAVVPENPAQVRPLLRPCPVCPWAMGCLVPWTVQGRTVLAGVEDQTLVYRPRDWPRCSWAAVSEFKWALPRWRGGSVCLPLTEIQIHVNVRDS